MDRGSIITQLTRIIDNTAVCNCASEFQIENYLYFLNQGYTLRTYGPRWAVEFVLSRQRPQNMYIRVL